MCKRPDTRVHCTGSVIHEEEHRIEDQEDREDELRGKPASRLFIHAFPQATRVVIGVEEPEGNSRHGLVAKEAGASVDGVVAHQVSQDHRHPQTAS